MRNVLKDFINGSQAKYSFLSDGIQYYSDGTYRVSFDAMESESKILESVFLDFERLAKDSGLFNARLQMSSSYFTLSADKEM